MQIPFVDLRAQYQALRPEIVAAIEDVLGGMQLAGGPNTRAFEAELAAYCGVEHAIGVGSGTDALYLALRACGIGPGDEVITVSNTFFATAEAIALLGAVPVYVDVDPETYTLDPSKLEAAIGPRTRAIVPVHLYGQLADMDAIMAVAAAHDLMVVEDACQAHGARDHRGRRAGSIGDAAAFSFYMSKNLGAYGEGGAVTTRSANIANAVRLIREHGAPRKYEHEVVGVNSRLDEIQAAVLRIKLRHLDVWNDRRRAHAAAYDAMLRVSGAPAQPPALPDGQQHVFHLYVVEVDERDRVRDELAERGIATGVHYPIPIHRQQASHGLGRVAGDLAVTERAAERILSLPMYPELTPAQIEHVVSCLAQSTSTHPIAIRS